MKTRAHFVAASLALATLLGTSPANASSPELRADVPFGFSAGTAVLAAGSYTVARLVGPQVLVMRSQNAGVILSAQLGQSAKGGTSPKLVFHRYGDRYYLRQVWFRGTSGYALPETPGERESAARSGQRASAPVVVTLVAALG